MILRAAFAFALLQTAASAQLQLFQFDGNTDHPITGIYDAGVAAPGDTLVTRFHIKNLGSQPVTVLINVVGAGFTFDVSGLNPYALGAQNELEFDTYFSPASIAAYSATITANSIVATVRASAIPAPILSFGAKQLNAGATADFGQIQWGTTTAGSFTLTNPNSKAVTISAITVVGTAFHGPAGVSTPFQLNPGVSATFQITFVPTLPGPASGSLSIDQRTFKLTGVALSPPLPRGTIQVNSTTAASAQNLSVLIVLAAPAQVTGAGTLQMKFLPAQGLSDDSAVQFLAGAKRSASVSITPGESFARLNNQTNLSFQTGTTTGSIVFTLALPNSNDAFTIGIAPVPVIFDTATGTRRLNALDVNLAGFDNTHSASQLAFTFYDTTGATIPPGAIHLDATSAFAKYFTANPSYGGMFTTLVTFPVTGDVGGVASVDVQMTNSAGTVSAQRISFQ